jgi:hypothetical protein
MGLGNVANLCMISLLRYTEMKLHTAAILLICLLTSCASYNIPSLDVTLSTPKAAVHDRPVNISKLVPYLKRATWSSFRQPFTVWKVWTDLVMANGTVVQILDQGPDFSSFRIVGVEGEYYIREEDRKEFDAVLRRTGISEASTHG